MYNPRLGRWLSPDPYGQYSSPYLAMGNNPISTIDKDGGIGQDVYQKQEDGSWKWIKESKGITLLDVNGSEISQSDWGLGWDLDLWRYNPDYFSALREVQGAGIMNCTDESNAAMQMSSFAMTNAGHAIQNGIAAGTSVYGLLKNPRGTINGIRSVFKSKKAVTTAAQSVDDIVDLLKPIDEYDGTIDLYRVLTGSETGSAQIFLTNSAEVAATYSKNGYGVAKYTVSQTAVKALEISGNLTYKTGIHGPYNVVSKEYVFWGSDVVKAINKIGQ